MVSMESTLKMMNKNFLFKVMAFGSRSSTEIKWLLANSEQVGATLIGGYHVAMLDLNFFNFFYIKKPMPMKSSA